MTQSDYKWLRVFSSQTTSDYERLQVTMGDYDSDCNFIKMRFQHRCFFVNIAKLLRTTILKNICQQLLLKKDGDRTFRELIKKIRTHVYKVLFPDESVIFCKTELNVISGKPKRPYKRPWWNKPWQTFGQQNLLQTTTHTLLYFRKRLWSKPKAETWTFCNIENAAFLILRIFPHSDWIGRVLRISLRTFFVEWLELLHFVNLANSISYNL